MSTNSYLRFFGQFESQTGGQPPAAPPNGRGVVAIAYVVEKDIANAHLFWRQSNTAPDPTDHDLGSDLGALRAWAASSLCVVGGSTFEQRLVDDIGQETCLKSPLCALLNGTQASGLIAIDDESFTTELVFPTIFPCPFGDGPLDDPARLLTRLTCRFDLAVKRDAGTRATQVFSIRDAAIHDNRNGGASHDARSLRGQRLGEARIEIEANDIVLPHTLGMAALGLEPSDVHEDTKIVSDIKWSLDLGAVQEPGFRQKISFKPGRLLRGTPAPKYGFLRPLPPIPAHGMQPERNQPVNFDLDQFGLGSYLRPAGSEKTSEPQIMIEIRVVRETEGAWGVTCQLDAELVVPSSDEPKNTRIWAHISGILSRIGQAAHDVNTEHPLSFAPNVLDVTSERAFTEFSITWRNPLPGDEERGYRWHPGALRECPTMRFRRQSTALIAAFPFISDRWRWNANLQDKPSRDRARASGATSVHARPWGGIALSLELTTPTHADATVPGSALVGGWAVEPNPTQKDAATGCRVDIELWTYRPDAAGARFSHPYYSPNRPHGGPDGGRSHDPVTTPTDIGYAIHLEDEGAFKLTQVTPLTVSRPRADIELGLDGELPLLFHRAADSSAAPYALDASETGDRDEDWHLTMKLRYAGNQDPRRPAEPHFLLGGEPLTALATVSQALSARADAADSSVARWDSSHRQWLVTHPDPILRYIYPAQTYGEAMDKPGRLHLYDRPANDTTHRPFKTAGGPERAETSYVIDYRLPTATDLWVNASDTGPQGEALPAWQAPVLFRGIGRAGGAGAGVRALRGEFLYGLAVSVDTARESGSGPRARAAEIDALSGIPLGELKLSSDASDDAQRLAAQWQALRRAIRSRVEAIELWMPVEDVAARFQRAAFDAGVSFALRRTALHRNPIDDTSTTPTPPIDGSPALRFAPSGLRGGALWPIESGNLLKALREFPDSNGGTLGNVTLGPVGGSADQVAEFLNGKARIIAETRGGYVQRQKIEVIGRIGAHYHRAKHVIVYERTTNFSPQFSPEATDARSRRPILRKVKEFVEILEPLREYPDLGAPHARYPGCLAQIRYDSRLISVDSRWGSDIGEYGWQVPLWNRASAAQRPKVYPFPAVVFGMHGDGDTGLNHQACANPENIYFYADFTPTLSSNTDTWNAVRGVDYPALPLLDAKAVASRPRSKDPAHADHEAQIDATLDRMLHSQAPPGHGRFTWKLAAGAGRSRLNHGRADKPLYAALDAITFARSEAAQGDGAFAGQLEDLFAPTNELAGLQAVEDAAARDVAARKTALREAATVLGQDPPNADAAEEALKALQPVLNAAISNDFANAIKEISSLTKKDAWFDKAHSKGMALLGDGGANPCEQLEQRIDAAFARQRLAIEHAVEQNLRRARLRIANLGSYQDVIDEISNTLQHDIAAVLAGVSFDVAQIDTALADARAIVGTLQADTLAVLERQRGQWRDVVASYDQNKPWSEYRLRRFRTESGAAIERATSALDELIDDARARLATALGRFGQPLASALRQALTASQTRLSADIQQVTSDATVAFELFDARMKGIAVVSADTKQRLEQWQKDTTNPALKDALGTVIEGTAALGSGIADGNQHLQAARGIFLSRAAAANADMKVHFETAQTELKNEEQTLRNALEAVKALYADDERKRALLSAWSDEAKGAASATIDILGSWIEAQGSWIDGTVNHVEKDIHDVQAYLRDTADRVFANAAEVVEDLQAAAAQVRNALDAQPLANKLTDELRRALTGMAAGVPPEWSTDNALRWLDEVNTTLVTTLAQGDKWLAELRDEASATCQRFLGDVRSVLARLGRIGEFEKELEAWKKQVGDYVKDWHQYKNKLDEVRNVITGFGADAARFEHDVRHARDTMVGYADRVLDEAGAVFSGRLAAAPGRALRLLSTLGRPPELPNLDYARERLRYYYDAAEDLIGTTQTKALLGKLGEALKAMHIELPFDGLSDRLVPKIDGQGAFSNIFPRFAGISFEKLFGDVDISKRVKDAVRITHDLDVEDGRVWLQADVALPLPERAKLFGIGPFRLDFVDTDLSGKLHAGANRDNDQVERSATARVLTNLDARVSGQTMVKFRDFLIEHDDHHGLRFELDPAKIDINPVMKTVNDVLGTLFPDEVGGLRLIKHGGIPVGVSYDFAVPPVNLAFGTSGITNLAFANHFELVAYPDFVISNRFALSSQERPFIFSVWILGGAGWLNLDTYYRPLADELEIVVDASIGASAFVGFGFAGVSGAVYFAFAANINYRKLLGSRGGGLSVGLMVVVAGNVDVLGIAHAYIGVVLSLTYRDSGNIDAQGRLSIRIRLCRFVKISVAVDVKYQLKGGKSQTTTSSSSSVSLDQRRMLKNRRTRS